MKKLLAVALFALSSIAFGATLNPIQLLNPTGSSSGQAIVSTGPTTAPGWGNVTAAALAAQAANTVVANVTASSASPTAVAIPSCSTSTSALQYTSGTGFSCTTNSASLTGAAFTGPVTISQNAVSTLLTLSNSQSGTGAVIKMTGDGATTPGKSLRAQAGQFGIVNDAFSAQIFTLTDAGVLSTTGGISNTPISGSTGSFTTLSSNAGLTVSAGGASVTGGISVATGGISVTSGAIAPVQTTGITGTTTSNNAIAGAVGEYVTNTTSGTTVTSGTPVNATSESLAAGDWDVQCDVITIPAGSTIVTQRGAAISTTSATLPSSITGAYSVLLYSSPAGQAEAFSSPVFRESLASTTTVYCVAPINFTTSTLTVNGFVRARRVR